MSDPNDVWQNSASNGDRESREGEGYSRDREAREGSPRRESRDEERRSPRRDRSRSPLARQPERERERGRPEDSAPVQNPGTNLHVSGLSRAVSEHALEDIFAKIGKVQKCQIMMDPHSQESRGFGFVMMENAEDAQAAIDQLTGQVLEGKSINVAHARRGRARTPTPGRYHGTKGDAPPRYGGGYGGGGGYDRPYQPRSYDSRYSDRPPRGYDDRERGYSRRDGRDGGERRYDDRRYDDRRDYGGRGDGGRGDSYYAPREGAGAASDYYRSDRDRYDRREERPRYDERPRY
ncbi:hypothetical protein IAT38_002634 [Cryptococcus sp. DSM 104549]